MGNTTDAILRLIDEFEWGNIKSQSYSCRDVPCALRGILFGDDTVARNSYWKIDNRLVVQGSLYEGAFYLVPFLLAFLATDLGRARRWLYDLLFEISNGVARLSDQVSYTEERQLFVYFVPNTTTEGVPLQVACRSAVARGLEIYLRDFQKADLDLAVKISDLLIGFSEYSFIIDEEFRRVREESGISEEKRRILDTTLREIRR